MSIFPCAEVDTDPAQTAWKNVEALTKIGASQEQIDEAMKVYVDEVEKMMRRKAGES